MTRSFTVVELFAGQGGFVSGFSRVEGWRHIAAVEIEEKHCKVLRQVFPDLNVIHSSVADVDWNNVLNGIEVDCVVGGPPCQPFSRGSKSQNGWDDPRNGIPMFVAAVKTINPKSVLMENVSALWGVTHRDHIITDVINEFKAMGFSHTTHHIVNAADFGAPCQRRRLFIYGTRSKHLSPQKTHKGRRVAARDFLLSSLEGRAPDGEPLPEWVMPKIQGAVGDIIIDCKQGNKVGRQFVSLDEPCFTLVASQGIRHRIRVDGQYYRMRAPDAAALQGMDPRCTVEGIGNAVNVWQAEAWARTIRDYLLSLGNEDE
jgi:site-specific DNA-cytosine methylase